MKPQYIPLLPYHYIYVNRKEMIQSTDTSSSTMENKYQIVQRMGIISLLSLFLILNLSATVAQDATEQGQKQNGLQTYIVRVKKPEGRITMQSEDLDSWYQSFLSSSGGSSSQQSRMVYSYRNVITGFAARLTADEVKAMEVQDGFISAQPQRILPLHTTHTPKFLGLHTNVGFWKEAKFGKSVIIGLLDTGIFPDHPSFSDERVPPPPVKWKGKCEFNGTVCNNKLIGARAFGNGREIVGAPPVDDEGHGTHTASTAAGNFVKDASVLGNANGTAAGMAPYAHLAMYKVCYAGGCADSDILAGLDTAIEDGVDIISISLGGFSVPFFDDSIAVGAFAAIQRGIFVSCSAGNSGPFLGSLSNEAPWILTVGASTIDRSIRATAVLGNGEEYNGESLFQPHDFSPTLLPLVYAGANGDESSVYCAPGSLSGVDVKGKVVLCERGGGVFDIDKGVAVPLAGGVAMILMNDEISGYSTLAEAHVLPATQLSYAAGLKILAYINSTSTPMATISFKGTIIGDPSAPAVTFFSSRGPSVASPGILKPDIIGPGVNILAAWPFPLNNDTSGKPTFNIISGTSMSCPHLAGIAALLKSSHPDWSPAAIKSAIMTTADLVNLGGKPILDERLLPADIFAIGAGHVNPSKANDPGFIYDLQPDDYIPYLCGLNYTDKEVGIIVQHPRVNCSELTSIPGGQLNYPSFSIVMGSTTQSYSRTVTNVGPANSSYSSELVIPPGLQAMSVAPAVIRFTEVNQKVTYTLGFYPDSRGVSQTYSQGYIRWFSDTHSVRTPISVFFE